MATYLGDFPLNGIVYFGWNSNDQLGASVTRATNGTVSVYKDDGTTQTTTGVTDTEDFDGLTGVHWVKVDTSADGTFYATGHDFAIVLSGAVIDGRTVNAVLAFFSINNRTALRPTTAGRTLDVDSDGQADANVVKVGPAGSGTAQTAGDLAALINTVDDFLDTEIAAIKAKTDNLPADPADASDIAALIDALPTANENADALLDRTAGVETGWTIRQTLRIVLAVLAGKINGAGSPTVNIRDMADSKNRIVATVDSDGNRTAVTRDAT